MLAASRTVSEIRFILAGSLFLSKLIKLGRTISAGVEPSCFLSRSVLEHEGCQSYLRAPSRKSLYLNILCNILVRFGENHREKGIRTEENLYGGGLRWALVARLWIDCLWGKTTR